MPRCRLRRRQGSWKQAAIVFWYFIFPSREGPRFQRRDEGGGGLSMKHLTIVHHRYSPHLICEGKCWSAPILDYFDPSLPLHLSPTTVCLSSHVVGVYLSALLLFPTISFTLAAVGWAIPMLRKMILEVGNYEYIFSQLSGVLEKWGAFKKK